MSHADDAVQGKLAALGAPTARPWTAPAARDVAQRCQHAVACWREA